MSIVNNGVHSYVNYVKHVCQCMWYDSGISRIKCFRKNYYQKLNNYFGSLLKSCLLSFVFAQRNYLLYFL